MRPPGFPRNQPGFPWNQPGFPQSSFLGLINDLWKILTSGVRFWGPHGLKTWFLLIFVFLDKTNLLFRKHIIIPFLIVGVGINTNNSPIIKNYKTTSINSILKKKVNNNKILNEIQKNYEKFLDQIINLNFMKLKKEILKNKWIILLVI